MAGVYIKGIEMPINADGCEVIIRIQPNGEVLDLHGFNIRATAISVPDHGRLIDADELEAEGADVCGLEYEYETVWGFSHDMIRDAPTIIPSDKE